MTALRILTATAGRAVHIVQTVSLRLSPEGGQSVARGNARFAVARDHVAALERRRADAAVLAAAVRHPVMAPRAGVRPVSLVAANG